MKTELFLLPEYPETQYLPYNINNINSKYIAHYNDYKCIFNSEVFVEEKIDGSNCGICYYDDNPIIRNRKHILNKGNIKNTPAKKQFSSIWNWFYDNVNKFKRLKEYISDVSVYGEWMYALHSVVYDRLPDYFIAYDLYEPRVNKYLSPEISRRFLEKSGFDVVPLLYQGSVTPELLDEFCNGNSAFSSNGKREGIYLKVSNGKYITHRFKMVRNGFSQRKNWNEKLVKNEIL